MAGKYYTMQEVMEKLGKSEQEIKNLVKEGKLRQFLDRGNPLFDPQQVDTLSADEHGLLDLTAAGTDFDLKLEETSEIKLEPDDEPELPKAPKGTESEGGFGLSMAGSGDDITSADTRASSMGINILDETDDAYKLTSDSLGETKAPAAGGGGGGDLEEIESLDADGNMESLGSGSGLLDLSLQADDTSLGAVLDDILPGGGGDAMDMGAADGADGAADEPAGLLDEVQETEEVTDMSMPVAGAAQADPMIQEIPAGPQAQLVAISPIDPATSAYGVTMFIPFIILVLAAIALGAGLMDITPSLLESLNSQMFGVGMVWVIVIGAVLLTLILLAVLSTALGGGGGSTAKTTSSKAKTAKTAKPAKEKKAKKEKKSKK